jgi:hypothetical protein
VGSNLEVYFIKLMVTGSLFLCIGSSGGIVSALESIPGRDRVLMCENFQAIHLERRHLLDEKSIPAYKIEVSWEMGDYIS